MSASRLSFMAVSACAAEEKKKGGISYEPMEIAAIQITR